MISGDDHRQYVINFIRSRRDAGLSLKQVFNQFSIMQERFPLLESWDSAPLEQIASAIIEWIQQNQEPDTSSEEESFAATAGCAPVTLIETTWKPASVKVTMNVGLDAAGSGGTDRDISRVVVFDNLFGEEERDQIMQTLLGAQASEEDSVPPCSKWEKNVCDDSGSQHHAGWGPKSDVMKRLLCENQGVQEIQSRLAKIYPEYKVAYIPQVDMTCTNTRAGRMVVNAPLPGENYSWHIDADPAMLPDSLFVQKFGRYRNRSKGKPLFVSLIVYLTSDWRRDWGGETLFLDLESDTTFGVLPKPGRAVLMDQDVTHKICSPTAAAGRPRYSIVWKLVFIPQDISMAPSISKSAWESVIFESIRDEHAKSPEKQDCTTETNQSVICRAAKRSKKVER